MEAKSVSGIMGGNSMGENPRNRLQRLSRLALVSAVIAFGVLAFQSCSQDFNTQFVENAPVKATRLTQANPTTSTSALNTARPVEEMGPDTFYLPLVNNPPPTWARTYYVDSAAGKDTYSCTQAQNPATPKKTVESIMYCNPGPGQTVRLKGIFKETIYPSRNGRVLNDVQDIAKVDGSVVVFNQDITGANPITDYITIYGSRRGNSGAFQILSVSGNRVTVDTSALPAGQFLPETASDPGNLQAAVLRPVHFTAWDRNNPPVFSGIYQAYHAINKSVIMVSYLKSISGEETNPGWPVWGAFEIDGSNAGKSDFQIFDHLEVIYAECAIAIEYNDFRSNYNIIQFNNLHNIGNGSEFSHEIIYYGQAYRPERHHDYGQIMYNKVGPHKNSPWIAGDGIEIKHSAHNATVFGNEIVGIQPVGCDDAPIKVAGLNAFIANNYLHDINPQANLGCGISIEDDNPLDPTSGAEGSILVNNILANIKGVGIRVIDVDNIQVLNNVVYNIFPEPNCNSDCLENSIGIAVQNWQGPTENIIIKNNIVQGVYIGIGRYIWSHEEYPVRIVSDYNIVFDATFPFRGTIQKNTHDLVMDPGFTDPENQNFTLMIDSPARDSGARLTGVFAIDNHDAADPRLPAITAPTIRSGSWDRGAYEE